MERVDARTALGELFSAQLKGEKLYDNGTLIAFSGRVQVYTATVVFL